MSTVETPSATPEQDERPAPDAAAIPAPGPETAAHELHDDDFLWVAKRGAVVGTPLAFAVLAVLGLFATSWDATVLLAALWPALAGGWYFGAIAVLAAVELRGRPGRRSDTSPG